MSKLQSLPNQTATLGDWELTILSDGIYFLDGGAMFGVVPKPLWERRMKSTGAGPDEQNRIPLGCNSVLARNGDLTLLIETGIGNKLDEKLKSFYDPEERLLENLQLAGVAPDDIDVVINSHLHFDHCGWNTVHKDGRAVATFPKAKYYAQRIEWEHANRQHERDRISYIGDNYNPLVESGQMTLLDGDAPIAPGVSVRVRPGHTRSMQSIMLESKGKKACYISDLIPTAWHLDLTWVMAYDLFPMETIESRRTFYDEALPEQWMILFTHDPLTPVAYLESPKPGKLTARVPLLGCHSERSEESL